MHKLMKILFLITSFSLYSHEGEKDKNGCHFKRRTDNFHCHESDRYKIKTQTDYIKTKYTPCHANLLDCSHFSRQFEAQKAFEHCGGKKNDIHYLDPDLDGVACENLQ